MDLDVVVERYLLIKLIERGRDRVDLGVADARGGEFGRLKGLDLDIAQKVDALLPHIDGRADRTAANIVAFEFDQLIGLGGLVCLGIDDVRGFDLEAVAALDLDVAFHIGGKILVRLGHIEHLLSGHNVGLFALFVVGFEVNVAKFLVIVRKRAGKGGLDEIFGQRAVGLEPFVAVDLGDDVGRELSVFAFEAKTGLVAFAVKPDQHRADGDHDDRQSGVADHLRQLGTQAEFA